jgi:hypothetical protein
MLPPPSAKAARASSLADWAELVLLMSGEAELSRDVLESALRGGDVQEADVELEAEAGVEEAPEAGQEEVHLSRETEADIQRESSLDTAFDEITERARIGARTYPFRLEDEVLRVESVAGEHVYYLLIVLSLRYAPYRGDKRAHQVEQAYDGISLVALRNLLGTTARAVRFARSTADDLEDGRPTSFSEAIGWLRTQMDLGPEGPPPDDGEEEHWEGPDVPNTYSDGGVDVVVWRPFLDARRGFPVLLAQCTVQIAWERKTSDVKPDRWRRWIDFGTVPPQKALVIPFDERENDLWDERIADAGLIIDRLRLCELLELSSDEELEILVPQETQRWCADELAGTERGP